MGKYGGVWWGRETFPGKRYAEVSSSTLVSGKDSWALLGNKGTSVELHSTSIFLWISSWSGISTATKMACSEWFPRNGSHEIDGQGLSAPSPWHSQYASGHIRTPYLDINSKEWHLVSNTHSHCVFHCKLSFLPTQKHCLRSPAGHLLEAKEEFCMAKKNGRRFLKSLPFTLNKIHLTSDLPF